MNVERLSTETNARPVTVHDGDRVWKGFDWDAMDRLYEQGYITDPCGKAKSVTLTEEGLARGERLLTELFGKQP